VLGQGPSSVDRAVWLNGAAAVSLEMDEASRVTRGHAASHTVFAVLASAEQAGCDADVVCAALLAGHEVASRFGRASRLRTGLHPHGSWGGIGAAAGVARIVQLDPIATAVAMDVAGGLMLAAPFACAPAGSPVRNQWVGFSNFAGVMAVRTAQARDADVVCGVAAQAYALALGELATAELTTDLGVSFAVMGDFVKRHAACGYSHAVLDAVEELFNDDEFPGCLDDIAEIRVHCTAQTAELDHVHTSTQLGALFSLPYLVAAAVQLRSTGPSLTDEAIRSDPAVLRLAQRVRTSVDPEIEARMPLDRGARVEVVLRRGLVLTREVPNARWDPRHHPATWQDVRTKADSLLAPLGCDAERLETWVRELTTCQPHTQHLPELLGKTSGGHH
jgi:2-methylcitrate dehydratase PrpD